MKKDNEVENIKKMMANDPYTHDGLTEYDGLPPMNPNPNVFGKSSLSPEEKKKSDEMVQQFINNLKNKESEC